MGEERIPVHENLKMIPGTRLQNGLKILQQSLSVVLQVGKLKLVCKYIQNQHYMYTSNTHGFPFKALKGVFK